MPPQLSADVLTTANAEAVIAACSRRAPTGMRNAALIAVLWRCGLRVGEVLALSPTDIGLDDGVVRVRRGKGGKPRAVGLDAGTAALIERWLHVRKRRVSVRNAPLFCTLRGGCIDDSYVRRLLPRLAQRAGVEKRVHAHAFRHAYAVGLEREGAPMSTIRDLLGHRSIATTDAYLRRLGATDAVDFSRSRSWSPPVTR